MSGIRSLTSSVRMSVSASATWFCTMRMSGFSASKSAIIWLKSSSASPLNWKKFSVVTPSEEPLVQPPSPIASPAVASTATARAVVRFLLVIVRLLARRCCRWCWVFSRPRSVRRPWPAGGTARAGVGRPPRVRGRSGSCRGAPRRAGTVRDRRRRRPSGSTRTAVPAVGVESRHPDAPGGVGDGCLGLRDREDGGCRIRRDHAAHIDPRVRAVDVHDAAGRDQRPQSLRERDPRHDLLRASHRRPRSDPIRCRSGRTGRRLR